MLEPGSSLIMTADSQKILTHEIENNDHPEARISITGRAVRSNFVGQDRKQLDLWGELLGMKDKLKNFVDASTQLAEEVKVLQQQLREEREQSRRLELKLQESEREKSGGEAGRDRGPGVRRSEAPAPVERESERVPQHRTYTDVARRDGAQWRPVNQDLKARREYRTKILMVTGLPKYNRPTGEWVRQQFEGTRIFEDVKIKDGGVTQFQTRNGFQMTQVEVESEEVATLVFRCDMRHNVLRECTSSRTDQKI